VQDISVHEEEEVQLH